MTDNLTPQEYYESESNWGKYQYISLDEIMDIFRIQYVNNLSVLSKVDDRVILLHAKRAIQDINLHINKNIKSIQMDVGDSCILVPPQDFVNLVRLSLFMNGKQIRLILDTNIKYATEILQDNEYYPLFDKDGNLLSPENSGLDKFRLNLEDSQITESLCPYNNEFGYYYGGYWYFSSARYLYVDPSKAFYAPRYNFDYDRNVFVFDHRLKGKSVIIEYKSDGLFKNDEQNILVHKDAEDYIYKYLLYNIARARVDIPQSRIYEFKKDMSYARTNTTMMLDTRLNYENLISVLQLQKRWIK